MDTQTDCDTVHSSLPETQISAIELLIDKHALSSAGFCVLIVLALMGISTPFDRPLLFALWFACVAIPLFLSIYIAKEDIVALRKHPSRKADRALSLIAYVSYFALLLLAAAIAMLAAHHSPPLGLVFFILVMASFWLSSLLRKITT